MLPPTADFSFTGGDCIAPCEVSFTNKSTGNSTSYQWNFGDNTNSTEANPKHTFQNGGTFTVTLTVTGPGGNSQPKTQQVTIKAAIPSSVWDKSFGGAIDDQLRSMVATSDGGFLLGGYSSSFATGGNKSATNYGRNDYWVVKVTGAGDKVWDKSFGGTNEDFLFATVPTSDGGFLLGGHSYSPGDGGNKTAPNYGGTDYWVVKINGNGDKIWEKTFGGTGDDQLRALVPTLDGGFLLGGASNSPVSASAVNGNKTAPGYGANDYWVVKIDASGNKVWDKSFGGATDDIALAMSANSDGTFLLGGYSNSGQTGNRTATNYGLTDFWAVKVDASGNKVWDKSFGGTSEDQLRSMVATSDGGFLLGGASASPATGGNKTAANYGLDDYWVVKINSGGDKVWDKTYGGAVDDILFTMLAVADDSFLLGGYSSSASDAGNKTATNFGSNDYWVVKINKNGEKIGEKSFGGSTDDQLRTLLSTSDGGFVLGGISTSPISANAAAGNKTATNYGSNDFWVLKIK
ncbi:PKD domain-containing protein [Spirosoma flavus]